MAPDRSLTISFTSDIHGFFSNIDYASGKEQNSGLCNCTGLFMRDGNSLVIDGGDTLQGSPFTYYYHKNVQGESYLPAQVMNAAGYQFITLGNHDFDYGVPLIETYLSQLHARCLCANVEGIRGVEKWAVVTMENGLRVGLTGVTSQYLPQWEPPENLRELQIRDAFEAAREAYLELKRENVDVTVCIYHGGFENDVNTGETVFATDENEGWRICLEMGFDVLLTGHQHQKIESADLFGTHVCQPSDKARGFLQLKVRVSEDAEFRHGVAVSSRYIPASETRDEAIWRLLADEEEKAKRWLDRPVGQLDVPLLPEDHLAMASKGSMIANFFNQVQREASGADISETGFANEVKGFDTSVSIRDVVSSYIFSNTLKVIEVDRHVLKAALERCAAYFALEADGKLTVSRDFLSPVVQHYNYDYFSGIESVFDIRKPVGQRVVSIRYQGEELPEGKKLTLALNNYRASGAGGYPLYAECPVLSSQSKEIAEMIMDYIGSHQNITVDKTRWLTVLH